MPTLSVYDRQRLAGILAAQHDVIARHQALRCGMTRRVIDHRLRQGGPWQKVLPGVYRAVTGALTPDQRAMAALLYAGPVAMITGPVAVRRHGLSCAGLNVIDVLVPEETRRKSSAFVQIQRTVRMPDSLWRTGPIRFAPLARAVADAARAMTRFSDVEALVCAAVQQGRCTLEELVNELDEGPTAGSRLLRRALAEVSDGVRSSAEADLKRIIDRSDLERPMYNAKLFAPDGTFLGCPDAWFKRAGVAAEADSREYHLNAEGYDETVSRHNRMEKAGIHVLHWLPSTIKTSPQTVLADLREALRSGRQRPPLPIMALPPDA